MALPPLNHDNAGRDKGLRSTKHRNWVKTHKCIAWRSGQCRGQIDCCHARDIAPRGHGGRKPDDGWCFSACRYHHDQSEKRELAWGQENGIDVAAMCIEFARNSPDKKIKDAAKSMRAAA